MRAQVPTAARGYTNESAKEAGEPAAPPKAPAPVSGWKHGGPMVPMPVGASYRPRTSPALPASAAEQMGARMELRVHAPVEAAQMASDPAWGEQSVEPREPHAVIQMACASSCACEKCSKSRGSGAPPVTIQRSVAPGAGPARVDATAVQSHLGAGSSLSSGVADRFSSAYGRDLSDVRVHEGSPTARDLGARAFTVGKDVAFAPGEYRPGTHDGDRLIGHELAHVVQQAGGEGAVQGSGLSEDAYEREADAAAATALSGGQVARMSAVGRGSIQHEKAPNATPPPGDTPSAAPAPGAAPAPADDDAKAALLAREDAALAKINARMGQVAATYLATSLAVLPPMEAIKARRELTRNLMFGGVVRRSAEPDERKGFDAAGPATAWAAAVSRGSGAAVVSADGFYFAVQLTGGEEFDRRHVYEFTPVSAGVLLGVGADGFTFTAGHRTEYQTKTDRAEGASIAIRPEERMAMPPPAKDLARLAGIQRPEDPAVAPAMTKDSKEPAAEDEDETEIEPAMVEGFLRQYFVARGLEALQANERFALDEMTTFKGAPPGQDSTAAMPPVAQKMIDDARRMGKSYKRLLDKEIELEELQAELGRSQMFGSGSSESVVALDRQPGLRLKIKNWKTRIESAKTLVAKAKADVLTKYPLLAQLIDLRQPRSELGVQARHAIGGVSMLLLGPVSGKVVSDAVTSGSNPYEGSELSRESSVEGDKAVRESYLVKLDAVLKAIGITKVSVLEGDLRELAGMPGLRQRVMADLATAKGKNKKLAQAADAKLQELGMSSGEIAATSMEIAGVVLQVAGLFFPPLEFIGAALSFSAAAYKVNRSLDAWRISQAAVTPEQALVDPVKAEEALVDDTLGLAMEALNTGMVLHTAVTALEAGRAPKAFIKELEEGSAGRGVKNAMKVIEQGRHAAEAEAGARGVGKAAEAGKDAEEAGKQAKAAAKDAKEAGHEATEASVKVSEVKESVDLTHEQLAQELQHIADNPHLLKGEPPHRYAEIGDGRHKWHEQPGGGWCRHSKTPIACTPKTAAPEGLHTGAAIAYASQAGDFQPVTRVLDPGEFERSVDVAGGVNPGKFRLKEKSTGKEYLFKPASREEPIRFVDPMGIRAGERARRSPAVSEIAERAGMETPKAELVSYQGEVGSLQEWRTDLEKQKTLLQIREEGSPLYYDILQSQQKKDLDSFNYLIGAMDAHEGDIIVFLDEGGRPTKLVQVDADASLPPLPQRFPMGRPLPGFHEPLPSTISKDLHQRLVAMNSSAGRAELRKVLQKSLTDQEIDSTFVRLGEILAGVDGGTIVVQ